VKPSTKRTSVLAPVFHALGCEHQVEGLVLEAEVGKVRDARSDGRVEGNVDSLVVSADLSAPVTDPLPIAAPYRTRIRGRIRVM
jgi:hypothetical protein